MYTNKQLDKWISEGFDLRDPIYRQAAVEEKAEEVLSGHSITGYWSSDKSGNKKISKSNLGKTVYYQVRTVNIPDGTLLNMQLFDEDNFFDDDDFPAGVDYKGKIIKTTVTANLTVRNSRGTIVVKLEENWKKAISEDFVGNFLTVKIELFWKIIGGYKQTLTSVLNVYHSNRYLYFNPPISGYTYPELLTSTGYTIVSAFGWAQKAREHAAKQLEGYKFFLGARILEKGYLVTNIGEIYQRKLSIYNYDVYTNDPDLEVKVVKASNFGFKDKKSGKVVTTKGISQIDYFANKSVMNNVSKIGSSLVELWEVKDLFDIMFSDGYGDIPTGIVPTPWAFANALLLEFVIKPEFELSMQSLKDAFISDFEIEKQKGFEACILFADSQAGGLIKLNYLQISTGTLRKLLKGDFLNLKQVRDYSVNSPIHTVFYYETYDEDRKADVAIIDCIFVGDQLLNSNV